MPRITASAIVSVIAIIPILLVGCTSATPTKPVSSPSVAASVAPSGDGTLRIGTVFPSTGVDAATGAAQVAGVEVAVREINEAGGVLGQPVVVFHRDGGDETTETVEASITDLAGKGVDVIVGPSSATLTRRASAASAGVPVIATGEIAEPAPGLFSTLASGPARSAAVAGALADDGLASVAIVSSEDDAGESAMESLSTALGADGASLAATEVTAGAQRQNLAAAKAVSAARPDAVVIATSPDTVPGVVTALLDAGLTGDRLWTTVPVDLSGALPPGAAAGVRGVVDEPVPDDAFAARVHSADPVVTDLGLAAQAYDAVILAATAAVVAGDDGSASVVAAVRDASGDGIPCESFAECLDVLTTRADIDYQGRSGPIDLDGSGRPTAGRFTIVEY